MRITVRSERNELTTQLRQLVVSRLQSALGPFSAHLESVDVRLETNTLHAHPGTTACDVVVKLRPTGEVRARAEDAKMNNAIARACSDLRGAVESEVSRLHAAPRTFRAADVSPDPLDLVLHDNKISLQQRKRLGGRRITCGRFAYASTGGRRGSTTTRGHRNC